MHAWKEVTGDSFVVDASKVRHNGKAVSYVSKYVVKGFRDRKALEARGFMRRYSFSRGWPGVPRMQLRITELDGWRKVTPVSLNYLKMVYPRIYEVVQDGGDSLARVGEDVTELVWGSRETRELKKALGKVKDGETTIPDRMETQSGPLGRGQGRGSNAHSSQRHPRERVGRNSSNLHGRHR